MNKELKPTWVKVPNAGETYRLKVYGGWIVNTSDGSQRTESSVFVPDKKHKWKI